MTQIKSLEELMALRDKHKEAVELRTTTEADTKVRIAVGMATCGIAAGARETLNAMVDEVKKQGLSQVILVQTGCMGTCYAEPVVEIRISGQPPVLYGKINADKGRQLVQKHIKNGEIQQAWVLKEEGGLA